MKQGKAIIFCAPSGSGKTTIAQHLLKVIPDMGFSISACTREPRGHHEENGKDYYFLKPEEFVSRIHKNEFVEWEEVYVGNFYGTLKEEVQRLWDLGKTIIFDVDVKGGINLKKYFGDSALAIFVKIPSIDLLEKRLRERATETEESIQKRLFKANFEMSFQDQFDVLLINENLPTALAEAETLVRTFINKK